MSQQNQATNLVWDTIMREAGRTSIDAPTITFIFMPNYGQYPNAAIWSMCGDWHTLPINVLDLQCPLITRAHAEGWNVISSDDAIDFDIQIDFVVIITVRTGPYQHDDLDVERKPAEELREIIDVMNPYLIFEMTIPASSLLDNSALALPRGEFRGRAGVAAFYHLECSVAALEDMFAVAGELNVRGLFPDQPDTLHTVWVLWAVRANDRIATAEDFDMARSFPMTIPEVSTSHLCYNFYDMLLSRDPDNRWWHDRWQRMQFECVIEERLDPFDPEFNHRAVELNKTAWPHTQLLIYSPVQTPRSPERLEDSGDEMDYDEMDYRREDSGDEINSERSEGSDDEMEEDLVAGLARIDFQDY